jgi:hypothetical protein
MVESSDKAEVIYYLNSDNTVLKWTSDTAAENFKFQDIHILMQYIKSETNPKVMKMMCKQLSEESISNLDLYLPQICYLIITKDQSTKELLDCVKALKQLVIDISMKDMNIGIRTLLYFKSWEEDGEKVAYSKKAQVFSADLEVSLVTKKRPIMLES